MCKNPLYNWFLIYKRSIAEISFMRVFYYPGRIHIFNIKVSVTQCFVIYEDMDPTYTSVSNRHNILNSVFFKYLLERKLKNVNFN